ncbi:MAG: LCP family protein, partial [Antricoccus sp.]
MPTHEALPELPAHLDPRQGAPRATGRRESPAPANRTRSEARAARSKGRRLAVISVRSLATALALVILLGTGFAHAAYTKLSKSSGNLASVDSGPGNVSAKGVDGRDLNILVVGNDSRDGYTADQLAQLSTTQDGGGVNTDTIMMIHVPANGAAASVVSFPRDSYVQIPGFGKNKINSAFTDGYSSAPQGATETQKRAAGQQVLTDTISKLTGVQIDHYVEVSLLGVVNLTNALGGVEVNLCQAAQEPNSGIDLPAGKTLLNGQQALSFVRQRYGLPNGDLDRVRRQQYFFGSVIRKALSTNLLNVSKLNNLIDAVGNTISYDPGLNPLDLADQMRNIAAGSVSFRTIPLAPEQFATIPDVGDVVVPVSPADLKQFFIDLSKQPPASSSGSSSSSAASSSSSSTPPSKVDPSTVSVDLFNGTTTEGMATEASKVVLAAGFGVDGVFAASDTTYTQTTIQYPANQLDQAKAVAALFPGAKLQVATDTPGKIRVIV